MRTSPAQLIRLASITESSNFSWRQKSFFGLLNIHLNVERGSINIYEETDDRRGAHSEGWLLGKGTTDYRISQLDITNLDLAVSTIIAKIETHVYGVSYIAAKAARLETGNRPYTGAVLVTICFEHQDTFAVGEAVFMQVDERDQQNWQLADVRVGAVIETNAFLGELKNGMVSTMPQVSTKNSKATAKPTIAVYNPDPETFAKLRTGVDAIFQEMLGAPAEKETDVKLDSPGPSQFFIAAAERQSSSPLSPLLRKSPSAPPYYSSPVGVSRSAAFPKSSPLYLAMPSQSPPTSSPTKGAKTAVLEETPSSSLPPVLHEIPLGVTGPESKEMVLPDATISDSQSSDSSLPSLDAIFRESESRRASLASRDDLLQSTVPSVIRTRHTSSARQKEQLPGPSGVPHRKRGASFSPAGSTHSDFVPLLPAATELSTRRNKPTLSAAPTPDNSPTAINEVTQRTTSSASVTSPPGEATSSERKRTRVRKRARLVSLTDLKTGFNDNIQDADTPDCS